MLDAGEYRRLPGTELADGTLARVAELKALLRQARGSDSGRGG